MKSVILCLIAVLCIGGSLAMASSVVGLGGSATLLEMSKYSTPNCTGAIEKIENYTAGNCSSPSSTQSFYYECSNDNSLMCLDYDDYGSATSCSGNDYLKDRVMCDYCYAIYPIFSSPKFFSVTGCEDPSKTTFNSDCNRNCSDCGTTTPIPFGTCITNPVSGSRLQFSKTPAKKCGNIITWRSFGKTDCNGPVVTKQKFLPDQCFPSSFSSTSVKWSCP